MLTTFLATLEQMSRILLLLVIGFSLNKFHILPKETEGIVSKLVTMLFLPCLMLHTNMTECQISAFASYSVLVLVGTGLCVGSMLLSYPLSRLLGGKDAFMRGVYRYALSFPNTGAVATPLVLAFFGTAGLFRFNLFWFAGMLATYTWGIAQMQPDNQKGSVWRILLKCLNPTMIAMVAGLILGLLGVNKWVPTIVSGTIKELGNCYVTLGILLAGFTIADYPAGQVLGNPRVYLYAAIRLLGLPLLVLALLLLCKAPPELCTMAILAYSGPCGMNAVLYPAAYGQDCKLGASMVLISSLSSVITIPVVYALSQHFIG